MEDLLQVVVCLSLVIAICLALIVRQLQRKHDKLVGFVVDIGRNHNYTAYIFANFIVANLYDTAKGRDLTDDEKMLFQKARQMMNDYEKLSEESKI